MQKQLTKDELWQKATAYCAQSEHCLQEVRTKLWQWGCTADSWQNDLLTRLVDDNYIDESRYAHAFVHDKVAYQGWGKVKIRMMLLSKGVKEKIVEQALQEIDTADYEKALQKAISKYDGDTDRQIRLALQRGFEYEEIKKSLSK